MLCTFAVVTWKQRGQNASSFYFTFNFLPISTKSGRLKRKSANTSHAVPSLNIVCYTYEKREHILHRNHYNMNESLAFTIRMIYILNQNYLHSIQAEDDYSLFCL